MSDVPSDSWRQASPALRDRFLNALDQRDTAAISASARDLQGCLNGLPGETCILLGLARGSTYGDAAAVIAAADAHAVAGTASVVPILPGS